MPRERENDLLKRIEYFQWVYESLDDDNKRYYIEIEWFDDLVLLSKEDVFDEINKSKEEIEDIKSKSFLKSLFQLLHRRS
jgi:hypothetical protein